jgi:hypothetical protein
MIKKIFFGLVIVGVLGAGLFATSRVFAQNTGNGQNYMANLVQKIADKFGLNKSDVQAVFDQDRTERQADMQKNREAKQAEMEAKFTAQLDQDLKDGKITQAQKDLIIAKRKELETARQTEMQSLQGKTGDELKAAMDAKKTQMQTQRTELENWAKQNNIDMKYFMGGFWGKGPGFGGMGFGRMHGMMDKELPIATPQASPVQ